LIENVQKNIDLIQKSKETIEKTCEQHAKNFQNISNLESGRNTGNSSVILDQVLGMTRNTIELNQEGAISLNKNEASRSDEKKSQLSTDDVKTGDERV
jgi:hypothetical protein